MYVQILSQHLIQISPHCTPQIAPLDDPAGAGFKVQRRWAKEGNRTAEFALKNLRFTKMGELVAMCSAEVRSFEAAPRVDLEGLVTYFIGMGMEKAEAPKNKFSVVSLNCKAVRENSLPEEAVQQMEGRIRRQAMLATQQMTFNACCTDCLDSSSAIRSHAQLMLGKSRARRRWCLRSAIQISLLFAGATASGRSFLTSPSSQGRAARCQRRAFDVATGAAVGTTFALFYDWSLRRKWEQPYLEMRVIDAVINNQAELKERVANLTAVTAAEVDVNSASEGWTRIYEKDEAPEKLRWIYQSEALRIASSSEDLQDLVIDGRPWPEGLSGLISSLPVGGAFGPMAVCLGHLVILVLVLPGWGAQAPGSDLPDQLDRRYVPAEVLAKPGSLGPVTGFAWKSPNGSELNITAGESLVSLTFVSPGTLRIRLAPSGEISDPTNGEIVTLSAESTSAKFVETSGGFEFSSGEVIVRGSRKPLMLSLYRAGSLVWKELRPMSWSTKRTWQTLSSVESESFYGCGMQNGFYDHTGRFVLIHEGGGWDAGGRANPAPFFMSSRGYGALRNTYKPGAYNFSKQVMLAHDEAGLDSFYFIGNSMKDVLNLYTRVAGRPMLPPIWGLFLGDSDCYNNARHKGTTSSALLVAKNYSKNAMPRGWMLVNDGYGCGYTSRNMLQATQRGLGDVGIRMGLWTSTGLANATWEIGHANSRVIKTDVAWVGHGYRFGLEAVKPPILCNSFLSDFCLDGAICWP
eukprot:g8699.t2